MSDTNLTLVDGSNVKSLLKVHILCENEKDKCTVTKEELTNMLKRMGLVRNRVCMADHDAKYGKFSNFLADQVTQRNVANTNVKVYPLQKAVTQDFKTKLADYQQIYTENQLEIIQKAGGLSYFDDFRSNFTDHLLLIRPEYVNRTPIDEMALQTAIQIRVAHNTFQDKTDAPHFGLFFYDEVDFAKQKLDNLQTRVVFVDDKDKADLIIVLHTKQDNETIESIKKAHNDDKDKMKKPYIYVIIHKAEPPTEDDDELSFSGDHATNFVYSESSGMIINTNVENPAFYYNYYDIEKIKHSEEMCGGSRAQNTQVFFDISDILTIYVLRQDALMALQRYFNIKRALVYKIDRQFVGRANYDAPIRAGPTPPKNPLRPVPSTTSQSSLNFNPTTGQPLSYQQTPINVDVSKPSIVSKRQQTSSVDRLESLIANGLGQNV